MAHEYETSMEWKGGKEGRVASPGLPPLEISSPPEFGGPAGRWTPEHFFVASANVCVLLTFVALAGFSKLAVLKAGSTARGRLEKEEGGYRFTGIDVALAIEIERVEDLERAERLVRKAETTCLVSRSMSTKVTVTPRITVHQ